MASRSKLATSTASSSSAEATISRSEEHTSELQSPCNLVCRLLLEEKALRGRDLPRLRQAPIGEIWLSHPACIQLRMASDDNSSCPASRRSHAFRATRSQQDK